MKFFGIPVVADGREDGDVHYLEVGEVADILEIAWPIS